MNDLLQDLKRDQQYERQIILFSKALPVVALITIATVVLMVSYNYFTNKQLAKDAIVSQRLLQIDQAASDDKALAKQLIEQVIAEQHLHASELAALQQVGMQNKAQAPVLLAAIADNPTYLYLTRSYAKLIWLNLQLSESLETIDQQKFLQYLDSLVRESSIFKGSANILSALWYIKTHDLAKARNILSKMVTDEALPLSIQSQARSILSNLEAHND